MSGIQRIAFATVLFLIVGIREPSAQTAKNAAAESNAKIEISIGQPVEDALQALRASDVAFVEGAMAIAVPADTSYITFTIDENHAFACLFYSKSTRKISKIFVVFFPGSQTQGKVYRSWIAAMELTLFADGSYAAHFAKPENVK